MATMAGMRKKFRVRKYKHPRLKFVVNHREAGTRKRSFFSCGNRGMSYMASQRVSVGQDGQFDSSDKRTQRSPHGSTGLTRQVHNCAPSLWSAPTFLGSRRIRGLALPSQRELPAPHADLTMRFTVLARTPRYSRTVASQLDTKLRSGCTDRLDLDTVQTGHMGNRVNREHG